MPKSLLGRVMFIQGGRCFFCNQTLPKGEASVEHLVPLVRQGANQEHNAVACCKTLNSILGSLELKAKIRVILNQNGKFKCPKVVQQLDAQQRAGGKPGPGTSGISK